MPMLLEQVPALLGAAGRIPEPVLPLWAMELIARVFGGTWLFCLGACVGSFLNVVVYRLPRGMNLAHPGSQCPRCGHAIRGRDNIPLVSWLLLRGRCRDCGEPISPRYYYVELVVGLTFLLVAVFEAFVPRGGGLSESGRALLSPRQTVQFWNAYGLHVVLLATLIGAALIDFDGFRTPRRLFAPVLLLALAIGISWPETRPLPAIPGYRGASWQVGMIDGAAGVAAGLALGALVGLGWRAGSRGRAWPRFAPVMLWASVGSVLGWQRTIVLAPIAVSVFAGLMAATRFTKTPNVVPLAGIVAALAGWVVVEWATILSPLALAVMDRPAIACAVAGLATFGAALASGAAAPGEYHIASPAAVPRAPPEPVPSTQPTEPYSP